MNKRKNSSPTEENIKMKSKPDFKKYIKELREHENAADEGDGDLAAHEVKKFIYFFIKLLLNITKKNLKTQTLKME